MKRIVLIVFVLLAWLRALANPVSEAQARLNAAAFFASAETGTKAPAVRPEDLRLVYTFPENATKTTADPAFYIYERPSGGYVVVSGDDAAIDILAYSLDSKFPVRDMPYNMRDGLRWYADIISYARSQGWSSAETKAGTPNLGNAVVLKTAKWNQFTPFNNLAPRINGEKPPIGCVATAAAIIMKYHRWPEQGVGTLPAYKSGNINIPDVSLGHIYDWSLMPDKASGFTQAESEQIARLLYDVAVLFQMEFGLEGSGASVWNAWHMTEHFGYDRQMILYLREDYHSQGLWEQMLKDEIDAGRPVLYSGYMEDGGHAFVVDGYNGRYFSINYGWGEGSAFYTLSPVEGHEKDLTEFADGQYAVFKLMPDQGGAPQTEMHLFDGGAPVSYEIGQNSKFTLRDCWLYIDSFIPANKEYEYTFAYTLFDGKGAFKEKISQETTLKMDFRIWYEIEPLECIISGNLAAGDRIVLAWKDPVSGEWIPVSQDPYDSIVLSDRPLSQQVKISFDGNRTEDAGKALNGEDLYVRIETQKDIPWVICREGSEEPLMWRCMWDYTEEDRALECYTEDNDSNPLTITNLWLPAGNYQAVFRNPLTGEEVKVHLEL